MAEEERKSSGCGLMVLYNGLFRRNNTTCTPRRSSSAGAASTATSTSTSNVTAPSTASNSKRLRPDLPIPNNGVNDQNQKPQQQQQMNQLPMVPVMKPMLHPKHQVPSYYQKRPGGAGERRGVQPGTGISGELDAIIYDHQRTKGNSTLVRASSSNVMLFGDLGNLRAGDGGGNRNSNLLDFLPPTAKEKGAPNSKPPNGVKDRGLITNGKDPPPPTGSPPSLCRALSTRLAPEELKEMGNEEYKNGRFAEALELYDRAINADPNKASYYSNKAAALTGLGRFLEAVKECREAVKIDPFYRRAHHRLAVLYLRLGEADKAVHHYKLAGTEANPKDLARAQKVQIHISRYNEARRMKDWQTVLKEAEAAISSGADSAPQVFSAQAEALLKLQRHQEAEMVLIDSPTFDIDESTKFYGVVGNSYVLTVRAQIDMSAGRFEEAVSVSQMAARIDPGSKEAAAVARKTKAVSLARSRGNDLFKASRFPEACKAYGDGLEHDSCNSVLLCNRAACRMKLNQFDKAVEDCTKALHLRTSYGKARLRRADCYAKMENWEAALQDYDVLIQETPGNEEIQKVIAEAQAQLKKQKDEGTNAAKSDIKSSIAVIFTDDQFTSILESTGTSVVLFYDKSSDSKQVIPFIEHLNTRYPYVTFAKVDVEDCPDLAKSEEVGSIPAFKVYKDGSRCKDINELNWEQLERCIKSLSS